MIMQIDQPVKVVTEKAIGIEDSAGEMCWFPKSQIENVVVEDGEDGDDMNVSAGALGVGDVVVEIEVPDWLGEKKEFAHGEDES